MFFDFNVSDDISLAAVKFGYNGVASNTLVEDINNFKKNEKNNKIYKFEENLLFKNQYVSLGINNSSFIKLKRLTVTVNNPQDVQKINQMGKSELLEYELLALRPTSDKTFQIIVQQADCDIISFDLTSKISYPLRRQQLGVAVSRGMFFEVCLGNALKDSTARRNLIANIENIVRFVPGSRIILTSGATHPADFRSPLDLANLSSVFGQ
eukprot:GHVL01026032.1.p2 GENE.GHVL01026032.1~~GHVL01026032.1.p2  ORF type:complete len:210 (+),score=53.62 GHVL01026032.1:23-652(+)